jgi:hypothetical protein
MSRSPCCIATIQNLIPPGILTIITLFGNSFTLYWDDRSFYNTFAHYRVKDYDQPEEDGYKTPDTPFPDGLHTLYTKYAATSVLSGFWTRALIAGEEAAEIALLMSLTSRLEHIEFCMPNLNLTEFTVPRCFWPSLLVASGEWDSARHFSRLESVVVHRRDGREKSYAESAYGFEIGSFLSFVQLPRMKVFQVEDDGIGDHMERPGDYPLNDKESHLNDLTTGVSSIYLEKVLQMLTRCTKLEAFQCHFLEHPWLVRGFSWNTIREALTSSRYTLKELTLNAPWISLLEATRRFFTNGSASIGSLTDFTTLRKLDVLQNTLIGFGVVNSTAAVPKLPFEELLPSILESLIIDQCTRAIIPYLEDMSIGLEDKFPHLQEIQLGEVGAKESDVAHLPEEQREIVTRRWNHRVERLKKRFISAGVQWLPPLERKDKY